MSVSRSPDAPLARVDVVAAARVKRRLAHAADSPWLHQEAASRMAERLSFIKRQPAVVMDWSPDAPLPSGTLAKASPQARVLYVRDAEQALVPAPWWRRLAGRGAHERWMSPSMAAGSQAQMLWSNMGLHLEPDVLAVMRQWRAAMAADSFVMFTTLGPGSLPSLRALYAECGWGEPHAPLTDMHDLGDMLVEAGFADPVMDQEILTLHYATPEALLQELREIGMNLSPGRFAGLRSRTWLTELKSALKRQADANGRIPLQLELVYGHAFRAADRGPTLSADTRIPLDDMKLMLRKRP
ncbi:biotin synthase [Ideonella paludis]|uniref:Biotin synthase n=2 Tax=Ideonella paludis TaxID=1233411 RepID=A0ABS5DWV4_9BURK|nr:biotin synthase [Ideonella paludis]MBQ0935554.1 biotin synthase [Ideonella paludis]